MGPGPVNVDPAVLHAAANQMIGQFDPVMTDYMNQAMDMYRQIFKTSNRCTLLVDGTARSGIEAVIVSGVRPGDRVLVPVCGRFGLLLCEIAGRCGAEVHTVTAEWGTVFTADQIEDAVKKVKPRLLLTVHGDTSTTMLQPLEDLGAICARRNVLFYTDATASLGGNPLEADARGLDAVSAGLQKCLGGPPGSAPVTLSEKLLQAVGRRKHVEAGIRTDKHVAGAEEHIHSNYFDLGMIMDYWGPERLNHHTESTTMLYAALEAARLVLEEGLDARIHRHEINGRAMAAGLSAMGLALFGDQTRRMNNVVAVHIPAGIDGEQVRRTLLDDFGIEIGTSFGPLRGKVWRIGVMGYNARKDCVLTTLVALEAVLHRFGHRTPQGAAPQAAWDCYV
jgi:(S)-ureidoglycine-glyoxylate aminotransferase